MQLRKLITGTARSAPVTTDGTVPLKVAPVRAMRATVFWRYSGVMVIALFIMANLLEGFLEPYFLRISMYDRQYTPARAVYYTLTEPRANIVFMGSSRASTGFRATLAAQEIAQQDGVYVRVANLGVTGSSIELQYALLKNSLETGKQPDIIVYGLAEFELNSRLTSPDGDYFASRLPYYTNALRLDDFDLYSGQTLEKKISFLLKQTLPLYRDHDLIRNALSIQFNPDDPLHQNYLLGSGLIDQILQEGSSPPPDLHGSERDLAQARDEYKNYLLNPYQFEGYQLDRLHDFLSLAQARGIKVILVNMPVSAEHRTFWNRPEDRQRYVQMVRGIAQEFDVPLLDLYEHNEQEIPADGFFDTHHLNQKGAAALTHLVVQRYLLQAYMQQGGSNLGSFYTAALSNPRLPEQMVAGRVYTGTLTVQNTSNYSWPASIIQEGSGVNVAYHWLDMSGQVIVHDGERSPLPAMQPGQQEQVGMVVKPPSQPGRYTLEIDLVYEGVSWFGTQGNPTLKLPVDVTGEGKEQ